MKKTRLLTILLLTMLLFGIVPVLNASADDSRYYRIDSYKVTVNLDSEGNAQVEERISYLFEGHFNGIYLNIDSSGTSGLTEYKVYKLTGNGTSEFIRNDTQSSGSYQLTKDGNLYKFKVFESSSNEDKTFILKYTLKDAVTKHSDIAEFNRKLVGRGWDVSLSNVDIKIVIPEGASKDQLKVYAHGPLEGNSEIADERTFSFKVDYIASGDFVETRVLFPLILVPGAKATGSLSLSEIVNQETAFAEEANKQREEARRYVEESNRRAAEEQAARYAEEMHNRVYGNFIIPVALVFWLFVIIFFYKKFDKEKKSSFSAQYYRELPGEYTPAEMSVLMNSGYVLPRDIMATLLDLMRKGIISIESCVIEERGFFKNKNVQDYRIVLKENTGSVQLKAHESYLISWFIHQIGNGSEVLLGYVKDYASDRHDGLKFKKSYDEWASCAVNEAAKNNFFDTGIKKGKILGCLAGLAYCGAAILLIMQLSDMRYLLLLAAGAILSIYSLAIKRKTAYGNEQYEMWQAFKRFLKDFSRLDKATIPSIAIWEYYLVYAVSLGVAKEVIKQLPIVFTEDDFNNTSLAYFNTIYYSNVYGGFDGFERMLNDTMSSVESSVSSAQSVASSQDSSSSGGGGGFSSGDSGGGGGSSGGGAF